MCIQEHSYIYLLANYVLLVCVDYMKLTVSNKPNATSNTVIVNTSSIATTNATTTTSMVTIPPASVATPVETTGTVYKIHVTTYVHMIVGLYTYVCMCLSLSCVIQYFC